MRPLRSTHLQTFNDLARCMLPLGKWIYLDAQSDVSVPSALRDVIRRVESVFNLPQSDILCRVEISIPKPVHCSARRLRVVYGLAAQLAIACPASEPPLIMPLTTTASPPSTKKSVSKITGCNTHHLTCREPGRRTPNLDIMLCKTFRGDTGRSLQDRHRTYSSDMAAKHKKGFMST